MVFENVYDAKKWFRSYSPFNDSGIEWFTYIKNKPTLKLGDWILFQHINCNDSPVLLSRPIYGVFAGYSIWDMALVVSFIESPRAFLRSTKYTTLGFDGKKRECFLSEEDPAIESIPLWFDNIYLLGHWKHRPPLKELKLALSKKLTVS